MILATCAHECEVFFGRLVVPTSTPRTITTTADILERPFEPVALMSRFPDVSGVTLTNRPCAAGTGPLARSRPRPAI